jgi:hypothetical protein
MSDDKGNFKLFNASLWSRQVWVAKLRHKIADVFAEKCRHYKLTLDKDFLNDFEAWLGFNFKVMWHLPDQTRIIMF